MKKYLIVILIVVFSSLNVNATCNKETLNDLKEQASVVQFKRNYDLQIDKNNKKIDTIYNILLIDKNPIFNYQYKLLKENKLNDITSDQNEIGTFNGGDKVIINIVGTGECDGKLIKTETLDLVPYNAYYYFNKEKCQKYSDFKYCKEWFNTLNISNEAFDKALNNYIQEYNKVHKNDFDMKQFIKILVTVIIVIGIITTIVFIIRKKIQNDPLRG